MATVEDVDQHSQRQPDYKSQPRNQREPEHESTAKNHRNYREQGYKRHAERAFAIWLSAAQKYNSERNQHERKQRPDIRDRKSVV